MKATREKRQTTTASRTVPAELVKEIPAVPGVAGGMSPVTKSMVDRVKTLKSGQIVKFTLSSPREARQRAKSLRAVRKGKRVSFSRVVRRAAEVYVEK